MKSNARVRAVEEEKIAAETDTRVARAELETLQGELSRARTARDGDRVAKQQLVALTAEKTSQAEHIAELEKTVAELKATRSSESRASSPDVLGAGTELRDLSRSLDRKREEVR